MPAPEDGGVLLAAAVDLLHPPEAMRQAVMEDLSHMIAWGGAPDWEPPKQLSRRLAKAEKNIETLLCDLIELGSRTLREIDDSDDDIVETLDAMGDKVRDKLGARSKGGAPVAEADRNLAKAALVRFEEWRTGQARPTSGDFPNFLVLVYKAALGRRDADLQRHIRHAFNDPHTLMQLRTLRDAHTRGELTCNLRDARKITCKDETPRRNRGVAS